MDNSITYSHTLAGIDWAQLKLNLKQDDFDNGRTPEQLRLSFENSRHVVFAWSEGRVVGKSRVLSDGVCNAYLVDGLDAVGISEAWDRAGDDPPASRGASRAAPLSAGGR
jgi:hypothetical protein